MVEVVTGLVVLVLGVGATLLLRAGGVVPPHILPTGVLHEVDQGLDLVPMNAANTVSV